MNRNAEHFNNLNKSDVTFYSIIFLLLFKIQFLIQINK